MYSNKFLVGSKVDVRRKAKRVIESPNFGFVCLMLIVKCIREHKQGQNIATTKNLDKIVSISLACVYPIKS